jgi:pyruvate,water dikinase
MQLARFLRIWAERLFTPEASLRRRYEAFRRLLAHDKRALESMTEIEEIHHGQIAADWTRVAALQRAFSWSVHGLVDALCEMRPGVYEALRERLDAIEAEVASVFASLRSPLGPPYILSMAEAAGRPELCGGKAAGLGRIASLSIPVPEGFAVTTAAFELFLERGGLTGPVEEMLSRARLDDPDGLDELCALMQESLDEAELPDEVATEVESAVERLAESGARLFAVRSSAVGEDGVLSYAGLYDSRLFVPKNEVARALREVYASKYSPRAVTYRIRNGVPDEESPMAVCVLRMLDPAVSGVCYTADGPPNEPHFAIFAVSGVGEKLVDGSADPAVWHLEREAGAVQKRPEEGALLDDSHLRDLFAWGMALEKDAGVAQDIEWCLDASGGLYVVQARPFRREEAAPCDPRVETCPGIANPVLLSGALTASGGVAVGRVHFPSHGDDGRDIPAGAVVVCRTLSPRLVSAMGRLTAVVSPAGSRAGHFASVAREHGVPVLVGAKDVMSALSPGRVVTVDADAGVVYEGVVEELRERARRERARPPTRLGERLAPVMPSLARLTLLDPESPSFSPENCESLHDIVRFCHEKGVAEMFSLSEGGRGLGGARPLATSLPLSFYVLDLDGGVNWDLADASVPAEALLSTPMHALWEGLTDPSVTWSEGLKHLDWEHFDRVAGGVISLSDKNLSSFALLARDYCHAMIRFGYHFAVVDALSGERDEANYVSFRFKGGGADFDRRLLRLEFLREVLARQGFAIKTRGDLIDAVFSRRPAAKTLGALRLLGVLLGKTRLMDMALGDAAQAQALAEEFLALHAGNGPSSPSTFDQKMV